MSNGEPTVVGGRYELGELLGRGGMAEVYRATDTRLGRTVAVKRMRTDLASDATFQARFRREAQSSAGLNHPAIVAVYDTGEELSTDGTDVPQPYIVMEYVAGRTLRDILRENRKILPQRALEIASEVLSALDFSHRSGIIHRDIKPGNVMLTPAGDVKVMDFGIARAVSEASSAMTQTAAVVGTAQYLSPEQARGETVDSRSDVYAAGCVLYELLTGQPPFAGDSPVAVAYQHVREQPTPPSHLDAELDDAVDAIVLKSLAKRVEDRYQSAASMRSDIERYLAGQPVHAAPADAQTSVFPAAAAAGAGGLAAGAAAAGDGGEDDGRPSTAEHPPVDDDRGRRRRQTGAWILVAALVLALLAAAAYFLPRLMEQPSDQVQVPNLVGKTEQEARRELGSVTGLDVGEVRYDSSQSVPRNQVINQDPNRGQYAEPGSDVDFTVSTGKPRIEVPYVVDQPRDQARTTLEDAGFQVEEQQTESDEDAGIVVRTEPAPGETRTEGSTVTIFYSDGPEEVPGVVDRQLPEARRILTDAGFQVEVVRSSDTQKPKGTVLRQTPTAGEQADDGSTVVLVVSSYEPPQENESPSESPSGSPNDSPGGGNSPSPSGGSSPSGDASGLGEELLGGN